ncbi:MAG TPA: hypothetical protein VJQ56_07690, partial [Blastocatellia bacterium]|nr:hypothetical protein [Blastocatellia bacterium]
ELGEQVKLERHLSDCDPCRVVRDDLLQIVHFGRHLPQQTPSGAVWTRIREGIEAERPSGLSSRARGWWMMMQGRYFNLNLPQLAASALALAIVVSTAILVARQGDSSQPQMLANTVPSMPSGANLLSNSDVKELEQRIEMLKSEVDRRKETWTPEVRLAFERNMVNVDQSLVECRTGLSKNPSDEFSQDLMLNAIREKMRVLEGFASF